jgi:hypothetical protein
MRKAGQKLDRSFAKGQIFLYILLFFLFIGLGLWFLRDNLISLYQDYYQYVLFPNSTQNSAQESIQKVDVSKWSSIDYPELGLRLKYPPLWTVSSDQKISQFGIPSSYNGSSILNIITVSSHRGVLVDGYYDQDLFYRIYNIKVDEAFAPEANNFQHVKFVKLLSGKLSSGQPYLVFRQERDTNYNNPNSYQAYILKGDTLIILTLSNFDQTGKEMLNQITANASLY